MKKVTSVLNLVIVAVIICMLSVSCKSKKETTTAMKVEDQGETLIEQYCSGPEFFSDEEHLRANSVGESMDQAVSKKKALTNAQAELAGAIETAIKALIDSYVNSRELNNAEQIEEKYEGLTRSIVDQNLRGIKTICEKVTKTKEDKYKTYIAIELAGDELLGPVLKQLSEDEMLKIDYDYEKFKEEFNKEFDKMKK
ncbi:hypothetical protein ACFLRZ_04850 [Bacteroidota bacterium]